LGDHGRVDLAGGDVRLAVQVPVEEALVVADVEVGLGAVLGDEHLAVLEGVHRAGVDVEVGVELLHRDPEAAGGEELAEARRGEAFAQRGRYPAGYEQMTGGARLHGTSAYIRTRGPGVLVLRSGVARRRLRRRRGVAPARGATTSLAARPPLRGRRRGPFTARYGAVGADRQVWVRRRRGGSGAGPAPSRRTARCEVR